jgi:hypothetical protein
MERPFTNLEMDYGANMNATALYDGHRASAFALLENTAATNIAQEEPIKRKHSVQRKNSRGPKPRQEIPEKPGRAESL